MDPKNVIMVEMLKEAALHKVTQFMLMRDRIEQELKGKQLIVNPKTGIETWVESRYPHTPDIVNDSKIARQILRDLGIIKEQEHRNSCMGAFRTPMHDLNKMHFYKII